VTLLRRITDGLGNTRYGANSGNVHKSRLFFSNSFVIQPTAKLDEFFARRCAPLRDGVDIGPREQQEEDVATVEELLQKHKSAVVVMNGPSANYADVLLLAPRKLVLVQCKTAGDAQTAAGFKSEVIEEFEKMGWPGSSNSKYAPHRQLTQELVRRCVGAQGSGAFTAAFTVELVFLFAGRCAGVPQFVTHGPFPINTESNTASVDEKDPPTFSTNITGIANTVVFNRWIIDCSSDQRPPSRDTDEQRKVPLETVRDRRRRHQTLVGNSNIRPECESSTGLHPLYPLGGCSQHDLLTGVTLSPPIPGHVSADELPHGK